MPTFCFQEHQSAIIKYQIETGFISGYFVWITMWRDCTGSKPCWATCFLGTNVLVFLSLALLVARTWSTLMVATHHHAQMIWGYTWAGQSADLLPHSCADRNVSTECCNKKFHQVDVTKNATKSQWLEAPPSRSRWKRHQVAETGNTTMLLWPEVPPGCSDRKCRQVAVTENAARLQWPETPPGGCDQKCDQVAMTRNVTRLKWSEMPPVDATQSVVTGNANRLLWLEMPPCCSDRKATKLNANRCRDEI